MMLCSKSCLFYMYHAFQNLCYSMITYMIVIGVILLILAIVAIVAFVCIRHQTRTQFVGSKNEKQQTNDKNIEKINVFFIL